MVSIRFCFGVNRSYFLKMATDAVWGEIFNRKKRRRLFLSLTVDCIRYAVWLHEIPSINPDSYWYLKLQNWAYHCCIIGFILAILAEYAMKACSRNSDTIIDAILVQLTIVLELSNLALSILLTVWIYYKTGPSFLIVTGLEFGISLYETSMDWYFASSLEVIPCELLVLLDPDPLDEQQDEIRLFIWYKMDMCLIILNDDDDRPETIMEPYRLPDYCPLADRKNHSPWLVTKINHILDNM